MFLLTHLLPLQRLAHGVRLPVLWSLLIFSPLAGAADGCQGGLSVLSSLDGGAVRMEVQLTTRAQPEVVWRVMTDYAGAAQFIRHLKHSSATHTGPDTVRVLQVGRAQWGPFAADVATDYMVQLRPQALTLHGQLLRGDVKDMQLDAALLPTPTGTLLRYTQVVRPAFWMPLTVVEPLLAERAKESFKDLQAEISRRAAHCAQGPST